MSATFLTGRAHSRGRKSFPGGRSLFGSSPVQTGKFQPKVTQSELLSAQAHEGSTEYISYTVTIVLESLL